MKLCDYFGAVLLVLLTVPGGDGGDPPKSSDASPAGQIALRLNPATGTIDVDHLKSTDLDSLAKVNWTPEQWNLLLAVRIAGGSPAAEEKRPAMLGSYKVADKVLRFEPRFPLEPGLRYRAVFEP